MLVGKAMNR